MSVIFEWWRDVPRYEQVRAASSAAAVPAIQHRDLPEVVADLRERAARLEAAAKLAPAANADGGSNHAPAVSETGEAGNGLRTERVTLEVTHRCMYPAAEWILEVVQEACSQPGESVRVVDEADAASDEAVAHGATLSALAEARESLAAANRGIARLTAERDAAIRERDAARAECERLRACADPFNEEMAVIAAWERCAITADWPADEPETAVRCAASMEREIVRLRARVAELEAAPAANAGGDQQEPVAWGVVNELGKRIAVLDDPPSDGWSGCTAVPLYDKPPRGWLTAEERDLIAGLTDDDDFTEEGQNIAKAILARETPPRVKRRGPWIISGVPGDGSQAWKPVIDATLAHRDDEWIAAIRAAGGEVE